MTAAGWVALAITIFGAFAYAAASIFQALGARRSTGTVKTLGHPLYLIGSFLDLLAWAASMVALSELAVYLVESVLAGSLAITVVAARVVLKSRLRGVDIVAIGVSMVALTVLAMSAGPQESVAPSTQLRLWFCGAALAIVLLGWGATKVAPPGVVAGIAGLCLGGAALAGRALTLPTDAMGGFGSAALAIVSEPMVAALLTFGIAGMVLYANALQRGQVGPVTAVLWIAEVIAPSAVAVLFLGDTVRPGWSMIAVVAGLVTVGTAVVLATAPATTAAAGQPVPQHALPAAPLSLPAVHAERIIWWGPPPIWVPPERRRLGLAAAAAPALTWAPPARQPLWTAGPQPSDADSVPAPRVPVVSPVFAAEAAQPRPWHDLHA